MCWKRLARVARFYGSKPQFICCSATIANPGELAAQLIEEKVEVVEENGAPAAEKLFVFYNPPMVNRHLGIRRSYLNETTRVAKEYCSPRKLQTIVLRQQPIAHRGCCSPIYSRQTGPQPEGKHGTRFADIAADICLASAAKSNAGCARGASEAWWQRMRSNWGSISARSTRA